MNLFSWNKTEHERKFEVFNEENPGIYAMFCKFALDRIAKGFKHYSGQAIMERVRWETGMNSNDPQFKINNNYIAYYSRKFMQMNPQHDGFIRTRELTNGKK